MPRVKGFVRKGGEKVKAFARAKPKLSSAERGRRATVAKTKLLPKSIAATGKKGFTETVEALKGKPGIKSPKKLAGWLKGQAKAKGELSSAHKYVGRKGFRKYPSAAKSKSPKAYSALLREKRK